jgi:hypothetical protein
LRTTYVEGTGLLHLLLLGRNRSHSPSPGVKVALHDDTLDLGDDTVVARRHLNGRHLRVCERNRLTLGGHENNLLVNLNALLESQKTGKHELSTVADGVDRAVLDNDALVARQKALKGRDDVTEVRLVAVVVVQPLGVEHVVESDQVLGLVHSSRPHTAQLLHVCADTEEKTEMHTQCTDVGSSFAAHPEHAQLPLVVELVQLALVNGTDTELTLDGRNERWSLEKSTGEGLEGARKLRLASGQLVVHANDADILLSGSLLRLDETGRAIDADDEAASDLGIKGTAVASLLDSIKKIS